MADTKAIVTKLTLDSTKFQSNVKESTKSLVGLGAVATGIAAAVGAVVVKMAAYQDEMAKTARAAGATSEEFSGLNFAAGQAAVSTEALAKNMSKLSGPSDAMVKKLSEIGIASKNSNGSLKTSTELMAELGDKVKAAKTPTEKTAIAVGVLGKAGGEMVSLLNLGSEGMAAMRKQAELLGITVGEKAAANAEKFNDSWDTLGKSVKGVANRFSETVIEMVNATGIVDAMSAAIQKVTGWWTGLSDSTKKTIVTIGAIVVGLTALAGVIAGMIALAPMAAGAFSAVGAAVTLMTGPIGLAVAAIAVLAAGFIKYWDQIKSSLEPVLKSLERLWTQLKDTAIDLFDNIMSAVDPLIKAVKDLAAPFIKMGSSIGDASSEVDYLGTAVKLVFNALLTGVQLGMTGISLLITAFKTWASVMWESAKAVGYFFTGQWEKAEESALNAIDAVTNGIDNIVTEAKNAGKAIAEIWKDPIVPKVDNSKVKESIKEQRKLQQEASNDPFVKQDKKNLGELEMAWDKLNGAIGSTKSGMGDVAMAGAGFASALMSSISVVTDAWSKLTSAIAQGMAIALERTQRDHEVAMIRLEKSQELAMQKMEASETAYVDALKSKYDAQLKALERTEAKKIAIIENASAMRLAAADEEFQKLKAIEEAKFLAFVESERMAFEAHKMLVMEQTLFKEEKMIADSKLEEDWKLYLESLQAGHDENMAEMAKNYSDKTKEIDSTTKIELSAADDEYKATMQAKQDQANAAIAAAEEVKNKKLKALDEKQKKEKEALAKKQAAAVWKAEVAQFEATKAANIASTIVAGITSAAITYASVASIAPPFTIPLAVALSAAVGATVAKQVSNISKQKPIKPASLVAERGGLLPGNQSHARGGIDVNAESGEIIIDRSRSEKILDAIENRVTQDGMGRGVNITINNYANPFEESTTKKLADDLGRRMALEGVFV